MDLGLTEDQEMLKKVAADFVKAEVSAHQMTQWYKNKQTFQPQLMKKAAELGWLGMMLPEEYGGAGVTTMDCAVVFEELGHGPVPGPLFTSGVLSTQIIFEAGTQQQRAALLPRLCKGEMIVVPALTDKAAYWGPEAVETRLSKTPNGYIMNGAKRFVFDAEAATDYLCAARTEEGKVVFLLVDAKSPWNHRHAAHRLPRFRCRSPLRQCGRLDQQPARVERVELGNIGSRIGQIVADSIRLPSRRHSGSLRHHLRIHTHPRGLWPAHRALSTRARSLRRYFD